jgi:hypothetical protein
VEADVTSADAQLFVELAHDTERHVAGLSKDDRAAMISSLIRAAHVCYAVWREGDAYRLRLLRCVEPTGDDETLSGIPVSGEAHADLLEAAASHGRELLQ